MFWLGDSAWGWGQTYWRIPKEILQGYSDNIPLCCCLYYTFVKIVTMTISSIFRTLMREPFGEGWKPDIFIFWKLFNCDFENVQRKYGRTIHSEDFRKLQYWRCPICKVADKKRKLRWGTGLKWEK